MFEEQPSEASSYGCFLVPPDEAILLTEDGEFEHWTWGNHTKKKAGEYLVYFCSLHHGMVLGKTLKESMVNFVRKDIELLKATKYKGMECAALLEKILALKGINKKIVRSMIDNIMDSFVREVECSGFHLLESLTKQKGLLHRLAPMHIKLFHLLVSESYAKSKNATPIQDSTEIPETFYGLKKPQGKGKVKFLFPAQGGKENQSMGGTEA